MNASGVCLRTHFSLQEKQNKKKALIQTIKFRVVLEFYGLKKTLFTGQGQPNFLGTTLLACLRTPILLH